MVNSAQARRRWLGLFFLVVATGMLIWGQTVLKPLLEGVWFLLYWLACFLVTGLAIVTAVLDIRAIGEETRKEQRELLERTWEDIKNKPDDWDRIK